VFDANADVVTIQRARRGDCDRFGYRFTGQKLARLDRWRNNHETL
jgi:hypothetical protein